MRARTLAIILSTTLLLPSLSFRPTGATLYKVTVASTSRAQLPAPEDVLGFRPGEDRKLASWAKVVEYFQKLAATSDRVTSAVVSPNCPARSRFTCTSSVG